MAVSNPIGEIQKRNDTPMNNHAGITINVNRNNMSKPINNRYAGITIAEITAKVPTIISSMTGKSNRNIPNNTARTNAIIAKNTKPNNNSAKTPVRTIPKNIPNTK